MRPLITIQNAWAYPFYAAVGGSFGYWLTGVQERQDHLLDDRKRRLLEKRKRRTERAAAAVEASVGVPVDDDQLERHGRKGNFIGGR